MTQVLYHFKSTQYNQILSVDFSALLSHGETLVSATAAASAYTGIDSNPSSLLDSTPSVSGNGVTQILQNGLDGVVYQVTLQATTSLGNTPIQTVLVAVSYVTTTDTDTITTTLGGMPSAAFTCVVTGFSAAFTDTSTDTGGTIASWAWAFGDGTVSNVQNPTHVYTAVGTTPVTLTITDSYSGRTSTVTTPVTVSSAAAGLVSPPGYASATYATSQDSDTFVATASLIFTLSSNGTWNITNHALSVLGSGNWYYPTTTGIGSVFTGKFTPTLTTTGTYWTLTNPASSATSLATDLVLGMVEHGVFDGADFTAGTMTVDIASTGSAGTSTGTFSFNVAISTGNGGTM